MERPADRWRRALARLWADLDGPGEPDAGWSGPDGLLPSPLAVGDLAMGSVGAAACAARELARARGVAAGTPHIESRRVAAAFRGDQLLRLDGASFPSFAPLSGFWPTSDGWVRTHANYPHHRRRLLGALGLPADGPADPDRLAAVMRERRSADVESVVTDAGGIAVSVRTEQEWDAHPHGRAASSAPLMQRSRHGASTAGPVPVVDAVDGRPARGVRVLDLTRVLAGPVATRTLALLGADVLRIDPPTMPELESQHLDTGFGKRSTVLDLRERGDRARLEELLASAHVVVTAYRPGAMAAFGLDPDGLAGRRPDLVVAALSAWGGGGPFAARRGFDSIVQAACGIAMRSRRADGSPGALPAQALDHATGYLTAAAVLLALCDRVRHGTGTTLRPALARTAHRLRTLPSSRSPESDDGTSVAGTGPASGPAADPASALTSELGSALTEDDCPAGRLRHPLPAFRTDGGPDTWDLVPGPWGADAPAWAAT